MEKINFNVNDGNKAWKGKLDLQEISEHLCIAELESRGSSFNIAMSCYYDDMGIQEWCLCVPNWDFGCKVSPLEPSWNEEQVAKYITNSTDRKSLAAGISEIFKIIEQNNRDREKELEEKRKNPTKTDEKDARKAAEIKIHQGR